MTNEQEKITITVEKTYKKIDAIERVSKLMLSIRQGISPSKKKELKDLLLFLGANESFFNIIIKQGQNPFVS